MTTDDLIKLLNTVYIKDWDKYYSKSNLFKLVIKEMDLLAQQIYILSKKEQCPENRIQINFKIAVLKRLGQDLRSISKKIEI